MFLLTHSISPGILPLDCSRETIYYFMTSYISRRLQIKDYFLQTLPISLFIRQNLWNQTALLLSRWLPRSLLQTENELYPSCCLHGRGGAAVASCERGHSEFQCLGPGKQLRWHCKLLLQFPNKNTKVLSLFLIQMTGYGVPATPDSQLYRPWNISNTIPFFWLWLWQRFQWWIVGPLHCSCFCTVLHFKSWGMRSCIDNYLPPFWW